MHSNEVVVEEAANNVSSRRSGPVGKHTATRIRCCENVLHSLSIVLDGWAIKFNFARLVAFG